MDQLLAIRAFSRVVEAGNFTKAADSLRMPKATVSKLVQTLEAHLGVQLLQRTTRLVAVTPDGAAYYDICAATSTRRCPFEYLTDVLARVQDHPANDIDALLGRMARGPRR
jgi:predicted transcriptional regulator